MDQKGRATAVSLENGPVVDLGGVWKKALKQGRHKGKSYPNIIHCRKCGKRILNGNWFYVKRVGNRNQKTEYYCEACFSSLWM